MIFDAAKTARRFGITVTKPELLQEALTHRSFLNEHRGYTLPHNERLEYLGDAVLELVVTEHLFHAFPKKPEGELTSLRAALVNGEMLARVGTSLGIESFLLMSRGEAKDTGRARLYLIANAVEAVIGALYLDQGYDATKIFIERVVLSQLSHVLDNKLYADPKSLFQEAAQEHAGVTPAYRILKEWGPDHDRHFVAGAFIGDELVAEGEGDSKQDAQRAAAKAALEKRSW